MKPVLALIAIFISASASAFTGNPPNYHAEESYSCADGTTYASVANGNHYTYFVNGQQLGKGKLTQHIILGDLDDAFQIKPAMDAEGNMYVPHHYEIRGPGGQSTMDLQTVRIESNGNRKFVHYVKEVKCYRN